MELDLIELAWAAGFYDGEGYTASVKLGGKTKAKNRYRSVSVNVSQVQREPLERFQKAVGGRGKIYGPRVSKNPKAQPHYIFQTTSVDQSKAILALLLPLLCEPKRQQAQNAIDIHEKYRIRRETSFPWCEHPRSEENTASDGRCRTCRRSYQRARYHLTK